jgi:hypothetical protein
VERSYYDEHGIKRNLALRLVKYRLSRNEMINCLEVVNEMALDKLEKIYDSLSVNQKKTNYSRAIKEIIDIKKSQL